MENYIDLAQKILKQIDNEEIRAFFYSRIAEMALSLPVDDFVQILKQVSQYDDGVEMLKNNWRIILNNCIRGLQILDIYKDIPEISKLVLEDVPYLINYANIDSPEMLVQKLSEFENGNTAIIQNFELLIENEILGLDKIFIPALSSKEGIAKVKENYLQIRQALDVEDFFNFIKAIANIEELEEEYQKNIFWANLYDDLVIPLPETLMYRLRVEQGLQYRSKVLLKRKIFKKIMSLDDEERAEKELILREIAGESKYQFKSAGFTSLVMQAGDKIVKLGEWKFKYRIPYHPRIMMPHFRKKYSDNSVLEVYNLGNTKSVQITDQELLKIYKELEAAGIIWGDAKKDNVLVLLQDNELPDFVRSEDFNLFGFLEDERFPTKNHKALKAGELVICDLDCLYAIDDPDCGHKDPDQIIIEYIESKKQVEEPGSGDGIRSDR